MSAFIVNPETLQSIATAAFHPQYDGSSLAPRVGKELIEAANANTPGELYAALYQMNEDAFCARYPGNNGERTRYPEDIGFTPWPGSTFDRDNPGCVINPRFDLPLLVKQAECLIYQCGEGDVPESPLFKALEKLRDRLAVAYVSQEESYENAPWG
jgi:hypothetical protein